MMRRKERRERRHDAKKGKEREKAQLGKERGGNKDSISLKMFI